MTGYHGQVPDTHARPLDWQADAMCRADPELFFDSGSQHEARTICTARCPVRTACLANVKEVEGGRGRDKRGGIVAGLTSRERWRLDATAPGHGPDAPVLQLSSDAPCGTYLALLRHLWHGEPVDPKCWGGEVRREHLRHPSRLFGNYEPNEGI